MNPLEKIIIERICKEGPISFEAFMEMALYYPELGYYTSPEIKIGIKGDFYTSPHLHKIFGIMLARQIEEMWQIMGKPSLFHIVEIAAGSGYLCRDILDYLKDRDFFNCLHYIIIEKNPHMVEIQKKLIGNKTSSAFSQETKYRDNVTWVPSLDELTPINGCIFSNELLDAFPVHIVEMQEKLKEVFVGYIQNKFNFILQDISSTDIINYINNFSISLSHGQRTEINLRIRDWLNKINHILSEGFVMTIDYGYTSKEYYNTDQPEGTLLCYYKHRITKDPFENIGMQDITAHVNFSSLKEWGEEAGFKTIGYCPQGTFLISLGIDEVITELYADTPEYENEILKIKGLILPQGMGESHKVMVQYKGSKNPQLRGFSLNNNLRYL
jgi:SAM-dependent MidA family methyltransferase